MFFGKEFKTNMINLQNDLRPQWNILRQKFRQKHDGIDSILFVEVVVTLVFQLILTVLQHVQQQCFVQLQIILLQLEARSLRGKSNLTEQALPSSVGLLEAQVQPHQLMKVDRVLTVVLVFGDVDEGIETLL